MLIYIYIKFSLYYNFMLFNKYKNNYKINKLSYILSIH